MNLRVLRRDKWHHGNYIADLDGVYVVSDVEELPAFVESHEEYLEAFHAEIYADRGEELDKPFRDEHSQESCVDACFRRSTVRSFTRSWAGRSARSWSHPSLVFMAVPSVKILETKI